MVRLHAALVAVVVAFSVYFVLDPCGGGGDVCVGGVVGIVAIAYAGIGVASIVTWRLARRASPLLVWDSLLITLAGSSLISSAGQAPVLVTLGLISMLVFGLPGAVLAGQAVTRHRYEPIVALVGLAATMLLGVVLIVAVVVGVVAMAIGCGLGRVVASRPVAGPDVG